MRTLPQPLAPLPQAGFHSHGDGRLSDGFGQIYGVTLLTMQQTSRHQRTRESGQALVETALVMPLFVFLVLGILQMGLITQARVMAKYAAYRAVRVGVMHGASPEAMTAAAVMHLLPVLSTTEDVIRPTTTAQEVLAKYQHVMETNTTVLPDEVPMVRAVICGPTEPELRGTTADPLPAADQFSVNGVGSTDEVDFDDPIHFIQDDQSPLTGRGMRAFNRLRLRVQLQYFYRMPIPFANWVINRIYLGASLPSVLMMQQEDPARAMAQSEQLSTVRAAAMNDIYLLPINVGYAMRMHSNLYLDASVLPQTNNCVHYGK